MTPEFYRGFRNRGVRRAIITSIVARIAGIALQVISLPLAAAVLGTEGFSVYAVLGAVLSWMMLSNLGISQATTLHMSRELNSDGDARRADIFNASLRLSLLISSSVALAAIGLTIFTPVVTQLFQTQLTALDVESAIVFICLVFFASQNLSIFEAAQIANQQQDRFNIATAIGTGLAAVAVYWVVRLDVSVLNILMAVHLPVLIARIINAGGVWRQSRQVLARANTTSLQASRFIVRDGLLFLSGTSVGNFLCHPFGILVMGVFGGTLMTASFAAVMNAVIIAAAFFGLVMAPFRGALPEAERRGDFEWIRRTYRITLVANSCYALLPTLLFALLGEQLFTLWYQGTVSPSRTLLIPAGLYMMCLGIEVTNYNFLASLGRVRLASIWSLAKSIATASSVCALAAAGHPNLAFWAILVVNVALSLVPLGIIANGVLRGDAEVRYA